jgi:hypothetical protein
MDPEATQLLSEDQARLFSALPIRFEEGVPLVAVADPTNDVLNRNIREALGQEVRFVVAGRTELNDVIGEAYSGTLRTVAPAPVAEPMAEPEAEPEPVEPEPVEPEAVEPVEAAPLRIDTSVSPIAEEPSVPADEPEPEAAPEPEAVPEPAPAFETVDPEPAFEAPVYEAPADEEPSMDPQPGPEPAAEPEPVTAFEVPAPAAEFEPPAPAFEAPIAPQPEVSLAAEPEVLLETEPIAPQSLPETNGQVPHDVEEELLVAEPPAPAAEPPAEAAPVAASPEVPASTDGVGFTVSVRLTSGERLTVAECGDIGEAKGYAKALTKQLGTADPDDWPFVNGRFLKPDTILSVDVEQS